LSSSSGKRDSGIDSTKISKIVADAINPRGEMRRRQTERERERERERESRLAKNIYI
jgi:hypothetical protein